MSSVGARQSEVSEHLSQREPGIPSGAMPPRLSWGSFAPAQPSQQSGGSRGQCGWNLTGASRNVTETSHQAQPVGELRFIMPADAEELTLQTLSPKQRDYRVFIDRL
ncbi:unnamed protein product [Rangifer tarandus platyrhynchus]|uniref:Uncharacterized protein n=1 Tax=Rangifer tarandus platyrhynchus TaxID=3082113 RepID=A0ABN9A8E8_RANTA|nr:unnamed protein product [Rangifer tarandus platyrhynchus]